MKILLINQPPNNRGDESAHKALVRSLLRNIPACQIKLLSPSLFRESVRQFAVKDPRFTYIPAPENNLYLFGFIRCCLKYSCTWLLWLHPTLWRYYSIYKWADVVVCAPGGICMGGFQDWHHLCYLVMSKLFHKPLAYYGRSFGPFPTETDSNRLFKKVSIDMLNYFSFLSIRDRKTEVMAQEMGFSYVPTVDTAFLDSPDVELPYEIRKTLDGISYMVFVPNYLRWHYFYKQIITHKEVVEFYKQIIRLVWKHNENMRIVMLPQTFLEDRYEYNDLQFFRDIAEEFDDSRIIVIPDCYSSDIQQTIIKMSNYLIGARYHSIVFSLNQATPFIALSYEHKITGLLETLGKTDYCIDIAKGMGNSELRNMLLEQIDILIPNVKADANAMIKSKHIANICMEKFVNFLNCYSS